MTISIGSTSLTGTNPHGTIEAAQWDYARVTQPFFGLTGEYILTGGLRGRQLKAWLLLHKYTSHKQIQDQLEVINALINTSGTLTYVVGTDSKTYTNTIFDGFSVDEPPWLDASGVNGWQVLGTLNMRQIKS
jgi:hypothetical protein